MNYHHIYHAGNFADVFKHVILTLCLENLQKKPDPFFVLDTHAGIGKYDLADEKSRKTSEAENGIKKYLTKPNSLTQHYLKVLAKTHCCKVEELSHKLKIYTGSPVIIKYFTRPQDRVILAELNQDTFYKLRRNFAGNQKFTLLNEDGFLLLKSQLPPKEKRGLILIDPAFEKDQKVISDDYKKIIINLKEAHRLFPQGTYLVWHPIIKKDEKTLQEFYQKMHELKFANMIHKTFALDNQDDNKMNACGMFIINAGFDIEEKLKSCLNI